MTDQEKMIINSKLQAEIEIVRDDIEDMEALVVPIPPDRAIGRITRMDAINNKSINESAMRNLTDRMMSLEYAMQHIDDSNFGNCDICGREIGIQRMVQLPESRKCSSCG
jgi:DnaK suppressor protein